jgi:hypothetical protein
VAKVFAKGLARDMDLLGETYQPFFKWGSLRSKGIRRCEFNLKSLWAFRDKHGRNWEGTVSVEPDRDKRGAFEVRIRVDLMTEK